MSDSVTQTYGAEKPSYYVYREGGRSPTKAHPNRFSAMKEAKRLAEKDLGATYHVLKVRATFVNTDASPAAPFDNTAKQMAAREGMTPGSIVEVAASHHAYAHEIGYVASLGEEPDTSVYVNIAGIGNNIRFSPSSLLLKSKRGPSPSDRISLGGLFGAALAAKAAEEPAPLDDTTTSDDSRPEGIGGILGLIAAIAAGSIARSRQRAAEEEAVDNSPEAQAAYAETRAIPLGTDVLVIAEPFTFLSSGVAYIGRLARLDEEQKYVWVTMTDSDTKETETVKVNASRIKRVDDPAMLVI